MMDTSWNNRNADWRALESELATLKRQHEQLRAAAVRAEEHLRVCGEWPVQSQRDVANVLRAALDATPAEPVPSSVIAGSRTTVVDGVTVTEFELTTAAKQALTVNATLPSSESARETVDPVWVLHQLEGLSFPEQGSAYDHMKRCIDSAQAVRDSERK